MTQFKDANEAQAAFNAFVANHGGVNGQLAQNAWGNAFGAQVHDEYENDCERWTVALNTAREYVDQGVVGY